MDDLSWQILNLRTELESHMRIEGRLADKVARLRSVVQAEVDCCIYCGGTGKRSTSGRNKNVECPSCRELREVLEETQ